MIHPYMWCLIDLRPYSTPVRSVTKSKFRISPTPSYPRKKYILDLHMYRLYNVYIMYTIAEFRKNMRQAFEDSSQGHEVVVDRYGQKFQLISLVDKPLGSHSFESVPKETPKIIKTPEQAKKAVEAIRKDNTTWTGPMWKKGKK